MAQKLLDIANIIYLLRFRVVWRLGGVKNTFARTFARFARTIPTPDCCHSLMTLSGQKGGNFSLFGQ
jgi:hypothetical protein